LRVVVMRLWISLKNRWLVLLRKIASQKLYEFWRWVAFLNIPNSGKCSSGALVL
jgi:hypothetical protein